MRSRSARVVGMTAFVALGAAAAPGCSSALGLDDYRSAGDEICSQYDDACQPSGDLPSKSECKSTVSDAKAEAIEKVLRRSCLEHHDCDALRACLADAGIDLSPDVSGCVTPDNLCVEDYECCTPNSCVFGWCAGCIGALGGCDSSADCCWTGGVSPECVVIDGQTSHQCTHACTFDGDCTDIASNAICLSGYCACPDGFCN